MHPDASFSNLDLWEQNIRQTEKILLKNLAGSSAFKSGAKNEVADDEISE